MEHRHHVKDMTMHYARKVIGDECEKLNIVFEPKLFKYHGQCYPYLLKIKYSDKFLSMNMDNENVLKWVVIEECAHLRHFHHNKDFYNLCIELGYDVRIKPYPRIECWRSMYRCQKCGDEKYYYHKQPKEVCTKCGNDKVNVVINEIYR